MAMDEWDGVDSPLCPLCGLDCCFPATSDPGEVPTIAP